MWHHHKNNILCLVRIVNRRPIPDERKKMIRSRLLVRGHSSENLDLAREPKNEHDYNQSADANPIDQFVRQKRVSNPNQSQPWSAPLLRLCASRRYERLERRRLVSIG